MINYSKLLKRIDVNELSKVVSKSTIERIKVGANMRLSTLEKICKYLKCQPEDLIDFITNIGNIITIMFYDIIIKV